MSYVADEAAGTRPDAAMRSQVRDYVLREFLPGEQPSNLGDETPLITAGILDSIAAVQLVTFLEEHFAVEFAASDVSIDNLDTIDRIVSCVQAKLEA